MVMSIMMKKNTMKSIMLQMVGLPGLDLSQNTKTKMMQTMKTKKRISIMIMRITLERMVNLQKRKKNKNKKDLKRRRVLTLKTLKDWTQSNLQSLVRNLVSLNWEILISRASKETLETSTGRTLSSTMKNTMKKKRKTKNKIRTIKKTTMTTITKKILNMMKKTMITKKKLYVNQISTQRTTSVKTTRYILESSRICLMSALSYLQAQAKIVGRYSTLTKSLAFQKKRSNLSSILKILLT